MGKKTLLSWSSGKDSSWALHILRQDPDIEVVGLFCTVNKVFNRVTMHGVRVELLQQQAKSINLPLHIIYIPNPCSYDEYNEVMKVFTNQSRQQGIDCFAFGDLFLEDIRKYREDNLKETGITPIFPLWGLPTKSLSQQMVSSGLKAIITCLDPKQIPLEFAGREYNKSFLSELPLNVDPCGENGEFHSFAFDGPMFETPIQIVKGETVHRDGFCFTDILPYSTIA